MATHVHNSRMHVGAHTPALRQPALPGTLEAGLTTSPRRREPRALGLHGPPGCALPPPPPPKPMRKKGWLGTLRAVARLGWPDRQVAMAVPVAPCVRQCAAGKSCAASETVDSHSCCTSCQAWQPRKPRRPSRACDRSATRLLCAAPTAADARAATCAASDAVALAVAAKAAEAAADAAAAATTIVNAADCFCLAADDRVRADGDGRAGTRRRPGAFKLPPPTAAHADASQSTWVNRRAKGAEGEGR
eukprot:360000-Chlamydomonas_euryale.AAC.3